MAQAPLKKSAKSAKPHNNTSKPTSKPINSNSQSKSGITKKGSRTFATKNVKLAKQQKMTKKFSAGLINETERMLGAKAGHLEILKGGKKKGGGGVAGGSGGGAGGKKGGNGGMESVKGKGRGRG